MTDKCGWCIGPEGAKLPHCNGARCTNCECNPNLEPGLRAPITAGRLVQPEKED